MNKLSHHIQKRVLAQATRNCRQHQQQAHRTFAVYTFGEGWTGALGTGSFDDISPDDPDGNGLYELKIPPSANNANGNNTKPVVRAAAAGWGHTALIVEDQNQDQSSEDDDASNRRLLLCGRPHEFRTLLRLKRLPYFVRNMAVQSSFQHAFQTRMWDYEQEQTTTTTATTTATTTTTPDVKQKPTKAEDESPLSSLVSSWSAFGRKEMWKFDKATNFTDSLSSILPELTEFSLPNGDTPAIPEDSASTTTSANGIIDASAGFTALIGKSGKLYTLGLNPYGQCGVGEECNNVWTPSPVLGLSSQYASETRNKLAQEYPIKSVALGLQHAIAVDEDGTMYGWGKGERGQLGNDSDSVPHASLIHVRSSNPSEGDRDANSHLTEREYRRLNRRKYVSSPILKVSNVSSGFNHSACVTTCNRVFVWGKNTSMEHVVTKTIFGKEQTQKRFQDSHQPIPITGLPTSKVVVDVTCGSHHTAILMEDGSVYGIGIATDNGDAILGEAVLMFPPGRVQMPVRQFTSHFDRTTIVSGDGRDVLEVHLWSHEDLRLDWTMVSSVPDWFERLLELRRGRETRVKMVEKGWLHTVIVTDEEDDNDDDEEEEVS